MRISLLQTPTAPLDVEVHGGIERVELEELEGLLRRGHRARLFAAKVIGRMEGVHATPDLGWRNRWLKFFYYIAFGLRTLGDDVLHGHYTPILALLYPRRALVHFHGLGISELILHRHFARRYHRAHYVFCARWVKEEFAEIYPDVPKDHLHVLHNGVDVEAIRPGSRTPGGEDPVNICFYAGWIPEKGIYEVLEAARILEKSGRRDFVVHYGGSAHSHYRGSRWGDADEIDRAVRQKAASLSTVRLIGNIRRADLPGFLAGMDLGLVPSTYPDPFPLVPLEMMAAGLPVLAYDLGGLRESVVDGETGFLLPAGRPDLLAERIARLLDHRDELVRMGAAARRHVEERFTWERHVDGLLRIYGRIAAGD